jgi:hypothetical protein
MPTLDDKGLKHYPGSVLYFRRKQRVLERKAVHKERLRQSILEREESTVLALKGRHQSPARSEFFEAKDYLGREIEKRPFEQISDRSNVGGYCRDRPTGVSEDEWAEELAQRKAAKNSLEKRCLEIMNGLGYDVTLATNENDPRNPVWITNFWFVPENMREEGKLKHAKNVCDYYDGLEAVMRKARLGCEWHEEAGAYIVWRPNKAKAGGRAQAKPKAKKTKSRRTK